MTTSDSAVRVMDTDGVIEKERKLDTLLNSETYQGMTDDEIDRIIEFRVEQAVQERDYAEYVERINDLKNTVRESMQESIDRADERFKTALSINPNFITVTGEVDSAETQEG